MSRQSKITFPSNLKLLRKQYDLTAAELAEKLGLAPTTVSTWERGKSYPDMLKYVELCELFEVSLDEMMFGWRGDGLDELTDMQRFLIKQLLKEFDKNTH